MRKWLMILMAVMLSLTLVACGSESKLTTGTNAVTEKLEEQAANATPVEDETIVGTWKGSVATMIFKEDGTGSMEVEGGGSKFFYTAKDGKLAITIEGETTESTYTITDGKMKLIGSGSADTYTLVK